MFVMRVTINAQLNANSEENDTKVSELSYSYIYI